MKTVFNKLILLFLMALLLTSCASTGELNDKGYTAESIKVRYQMTYTGAIEILMMKLGTLEAAMPDDVKVEWIQVEGATASKEALVGGSLDFASFNNVAWMSAVENDLPLYLLSNSMISSTKFYTRNPDVKSISDIPADSKIYMSSGIMSCHGLAFVLEASKYFNDVEEIAGNIVDMTKVEIISSLLASDDIQYAVINFPQLLVIEEKDLMTPVYDLSAIAKENGLSLVNVTSQKFANDNPELVKMYLAEYHNTLDYMNNNPREAAEILAEFFDDISSDEFYAEIVSCPTVFQISESGYDKVGQLMFQVGLLEKEPKKLSELPNYKDLPLAP